MKQVQLKVDILIFARFHMNINFKNFNI